MSIFTETQVIKNQRNAFSLSHDFKFTGNMGRLIPILNLEVNPNENFTITPHCLTRFQPLWAPFMHEVNLHMEFFYVPRRILWDNWNDFISSKQTETPIAHPYLSYAADPLQEQDFTGTLIDYLGAPVISPSPLTPEGAYRPRIDAMPFAAYSMIYNEYYRDQNLIQEIHDECQDGNNNTLFGNVARGKPLKRAWEHDYFTSCLPFAQKGNIVQLPLTNSETIDVYLRDYDGQKYEQFWLSETGTRSTPGDAQFTFDGSKTPPDDGMLADMTSSTNHILNPAGDYRVDVNEEAVTISTLRYAISMQSYLEALARGGTRINEWIENIHGGKVSDARVQRPEYIGGLKKPVTVVDVISTARTEDSERNITPLGDYGGQAQVGASGQTFSYHCEEHGFIIGILSVLPRTAYSQGIGRKWQRFDPFDYMIPMFENVGEQMVTRKEVRYPHVEPHAEFGYIPRNAELKFENSRIAGDMRTSLKDWHFARELPNNVALNADFISCTPRKDVFAVTSPDEHELICHCYFDIKAVRNMSRFANPKIR